VGSESNGFQVEKMNNLKGIYALWYREFKVFIREKSRLGFSIINPLVWLLVVGGGLGSVVSFSGVNYKTFLYPGILIQSVVFSSVFFGVYIVLDKKIDFMKEVLVAPISRTAMFVGKVVGGSTDALIEIITLLVIGYILESTGILAGVSINFVSGIVSLGFLLATTVAMVSLGLIIGSQMESTEGFQLVASFLLFPLFFLSGALFPITNLPSWLSPIVLLNPITYSVDGLRGVLIGVSKFNIGLDFAVIGIFALITISIGTYAFKRMEV
jgi:ABC-2 type transport system permease protein